MRLTIDFDPAGATAGLAAPTLAEGQTSTTGGTTWVASQDSGLNAGAFSPVAEAQGLTTERRGIHSALVSGLNAGAFSATRKDGQSPGTSREGNLVSIAEPPPPHADDFGLTSRSAAAKQTANAGSFKN